MTSQTLDDAVSRHGITHCRVLVHDDVVSHGLDSVATVGVGPR
jgi:hypothetical protein